MYSNRNKKPLTKAFVIPAKLLHNWRRRQQAMQEYSHLVFSDLYLGADNLAAGPANIYTFAARWWATALGFAPEQAVGRAIYEWPFKSCNYEIFCQAAELFFGLFGLAAMPDWSTRLCKSDTERATDRETTAIESKQTDYDNDDDEASPPQLAKWKTRAWVVAGWGFFRCCWYCVFL